MSQKHTLTIEWESLWDSRAMRPDGKDAVIIESAIKQMMRDIVDHEARHIFVSINGERLYGPEIQEI